MADTRKTVLITGCAPGGIGHALALDFHNAGLRVFATARDAAQLEDLAALGIETFSFDVTAQADRVRIRETLERVAGGGLDVLVNNAGKNCTVPAIEVTDSDIESTFTTNIISVISTIRELSPLLIRTKGKIVNIGSITAVTPYVFGAVYNATKGALQAYSNTLRLELAPFGVRVILVVTGGVQSRIARTDRTLGEDSLYLPIEEEYLRRVKHSQEGAMPTKAYSASVVHEVLKANPQNWVWQGNKSWIIWFLDRFAPRSVWDYIFPKMFGLARLRQIVAKRESDKRKQTGPWQPADRHSPVESAQNLSPVRKTGEGLRRLAAAAHHGEGPPSPSPRNAHIPMGMRQTGKRMWDAAADCQLLSPACAAHLGEGLAGPLLRNAHILMELRKTGSWRRILSPVLRNAPPSVGCRLRRVPPITRGTGAADKGSTAHITPIAQ
ncbi:hypothetical protein V496_05519 [Pseudogymnoascus sp. VKM F-4515 (FW-2607)]|nr:hypothetical protein V496_05519 [Pseudogymnoascus sp. VKM F-4515 (FW-2607)]